MSSEYKNLIVDVSTLEDGKFFKVYTDSNGTTLLIPKDDEDNLIKKVSDIEKKMSILETKDNEDSMNITNSPNAVINIIRDNAEDRYKRIDVENITELAIPYKGIVSNIKVFNKIDSSLPNKNLFEQVEEGVQIMYSEDTVSSEKQIIINSNNPITGYIEIFNI